MSSLTHLLFFFFFLALSLHACHARRHLVFPPALHNPNHPTKQMEFLHDSLSGVRIPEDHQKQQQYVGNSYLQNFGDHVATIILQKLFSALTTSGRDGQTWEKEMKTVQLARSMLGSQADGAGGEELVGYEGNDAVEDIVVMDYAQPHRKPPIHNDKP